MLIAGIIALALLVSATLVWFAFRAWKAEAEIVAMRAQVAEVSVLRDEIALLRAGVGRLMTRMADYGDAQRALIDDVAGQRKAIETLVRMLSEKKQRPIPPPSSSGVRVKGRVHYIDEGSTVAACNVGIDDITKVSGLEERGWSADVAKVTCEPCIERLAAPSDTAETTVMSRKSA